MNLLYRSYAVLEIIDQETGEVVHHEVSKAVEAESLLELMGHGSVEESTSQLSVDVSTPAVEYDEDGLAKEPEIITHDLSESVEKVVYGDAEATVVNEKDTIFADMTEPELVEEPKEDDVLSHVSPEVLAESLAGDSESPNDFGQLLDVALDPTSPTLTEDHTYSPDAMDTSEGASAETVDSTPEKAEEEDDVEIDLPGVFDMSQLFADDDDEEEAAPQEDTPVVEPSPEPVADEPLSTQDAINVLSGLMDDDDAVDVTPTYPEDTVDIADADDFKARFNSLDSLWKA